MSTTSPGRAYDRYWPVAQIVGPAATCASSAAIAAPSPAPPNRKSPPVQIPGVTGSFQRNRLCVGSRPRNVRVSIAGRDRTANVAAH